MAAVPWSCSGRPTTRAAVGQPPRAPQRGAGRRHRLPHHHRHPRPAEEAGRPRRGPGRVLAGHRADVPRRARRPDCFCERSSHRRVPRDHHPHPAADHPRRGRHRSPSYYERYGGMRDLGAINHTSTSPSTGRSPTTTSSSTRPWSGWTTGRGDRASRSSGRRCCSTRSGPCIEMVSMADIPSGTGLGSSGAFTVGPAAGHLRLPARARHRRRPGRGGVPIEIDRLGRPVGKQDQYIAAFGG